MPKFLFVIAHPEQKSFNHALVRTAVETLEQKGNEVRVVDLYQHNWNPVSGRGNFLISKDTEFFNQQSEEIFAASTGGFSPEVQSQMDLLLWCDVLVLQFPLWWFSVPAILKGWVDKVFAMGVTFAAGNTYKDGLLAGKKAMVSMTTGGEKSAFMKGGKHPSLESVLVPIHHGIFLYNGMSVLEPFVAWEPAHLPIELRQKYLTDFSQRVLRIE